MPSHGALGSRWIDTNLTHQTVTAYEHDRPIYMTSTSSGRPGWETHEGIHEILWRKENETMDSESLVGRDAARASYRIENIRWTQYFTSDGQAIHENFWRDPALFGIPSSHGCLGMGAQDALWFWLWAGPGVPISVHY
jgi:lipoprotein-anchoring transpeptidase ErfK/SrfK